MQAAASFARAGARTTLLHARRARVPALPAGSDLFAHYAVPEGPRPELVAAPCVDLIDRLPRRLQYLPARLQELSFARSAARWIGRERPGAAVLARELECARHLVRAGRRGVFLEVHRVPGGAARRAWLREAAAGAAGVLAISGGVRADLAELGVAADKLRVEHDAVDAQRFADLPARDEARRQLGLAPDRPLVVYTGGLMDWKGVDVLVDAARELPEASFAIAGGMEQDVARLRARAQGLANVRVDGFVPPARVALYLAAADVGVVPNRSEPAIAARYTSPLKVFEAMAAGLPLVVSDLPALRDVLGDDEAVFVPPDLPGPLAAALRALLADPARRARLGAALAARAPEAGWDARARRILDWMGERA
jgi:glycosyltransferase involved in cell wall biosynthesis